MTKPKFTDDDLRRLKEWSSSVVQAGSYPKEKLDALLFRLLLAERRAIFAYEPHTEGCRSRDTVWRTADGQPKCNCGFEDADVAWRLVAGKL
jgi:hypothetical protein